MVYITQDYNGNYIHCDREYLEIGEKCNIRGKYFYIISKPIQITNTIFKYSIDCTINSKSGDEVICLSMSGVAFEVIDNTIDLKSIPLDSLLWVNNSKIQKEIEKNKPHQTPEEYRPYLVPSGIFD